MNKIVNLAIESFYIQYIIKLLRNSFDLLYYTSAYINRIESFDLIWKFTPPGRITIKMHPILADTQIQNDLEFSPSRELSRFPQKHTPKTCSIFDVAIPTPKRTKSNEEFH